MPTPRSEILHVRLSPEERERLRRAAKVEYLDQSAWARRAILQALDDAATHRTAHPEGRGARERKPGTSSTRD